MNRVTCLALSSFSMVCPARISLRDCDLIGFNVGAWRGHCAVGRKPKPANHLSRFSPESNLADDLTHKKSFGCS